MFWIFGISGEYKNTLQSKFSGKNILFSYSSDNLIILGGGCSKNLFFNKINENEGWLVSGIGIAAKKNSYQFLDSNDWKKIFINHEKTDKINGHFICVK